MYTDLRPIGLQSLTAWLEKRRAPKRRKHMEQLLEQYGCVGLEGFLRVTHALSLNDTFWVKEESETLCWDEASLYRNEFDALMQRVTGVLSMCAEGQDPDGCDPDACGCTGSCATCGGGCH